MKFPIVSTLVSALLVSTALPAFAQQICEKYGEATVGEFKLQNNIWNADTAQCIEPLGSSGFRVVSAEHNITTAGPPAAYPFIWKGCHWTSCTSDRGSFPIQVREIGSASYNWNISVPSGGSWNAAPEAWFNTTSTPGAPDGAELMFWFNWSGSVQPGGTQVDTINVDGVNWEVWMTDIGWNFITYRRSGKITSGSVNVLPFIQDSINRGWISPDWYMMGMEAGFEIWNGGAGLTTRGSAVILEKFAKMTLIH